MVVIFGAFFIFVVGVVVFFCGWKLRLLVASVGYTIRAKY